MLAGLIGALVVLAITLAGFGSFSATSRHDARVGTGTPTPTASSGGRAAPGATHIPNLGLVSPRTAASARLQAALNHALTAAGPHSGALVYDLGGRQPVFSRRATVRRPPASVEKLYTTVALMRILGPDARLHTTVLGTGRLAGGVWHGDLYLRGGGDPTFGDAGFDQAYNHGYGATAGGLVAQLRARGIRRVTGRVYGDESLFDRHRGGLLTNYAPDTPDFGGQLSALEYDHGSALRRLSPARFAVKEFVLTLRGSQIAARAASRTATTPTAAQLLASVASPPLSVMARLMDVPSDDLFAELFTKQLGVLFGSGGTIAAGAGVIRGTIAAGFGLRPTILDGSGLSRNDRSSPEEIVELLRDVWRTAIGRELADSLPTVGVNGTVQYIGLKTAARGRCVAKTGTLDNVTNLAGYCHSRTGRNVAFALEIDGPSNSTAVLLVSRMIGAIARY